MSARMMGIGRTLATTIAVASAGCSALFPAPATTSRADAAATGVDGQIAAGGDAPADTSVAVDAPSAADADAAADVSDAAADAGGSCLCPEGQVVRVGACVPTFDLGCGPACVAKAPSACPGQGVCDELAAHVPCAPASPAATCVPGQGMSFEPGALRVAPTTATAGVATTLRVRGGTFYIGALMWWVRVAGTSLQGDEYSKSCELSASWTPKTAGIYAVQAGYGGGEATGSHGWALAGFVRVGPGGLLGQPGTVCASDTACQSGDGFACGCVAGRCQCAPSP